MSTRIGYIREEIPDYEIPVYRGERYDAMVPDTLDLAERARLAIRGLTGPTDADADYELYWHVDFWSNPPTMTHDWNDWVQKKFEEPLPLLRIVTGSDSGLEADRARMAAHLHSIGPDGLLYYSCEGRPWAFKGIGFNNTIWKATGEQGHLPDDTIKHLSPWTGGSDAISSLIVYYLRDRNPIWKETIEHMIEGWSERVIDRGDYAYIPSGFFEPGAPLAQDAPMPVGGEGAERVMWNLIGLARYYRLTGYGPARELSAKLVAYLKDHIGFFNPDGSFPPDRVRQYPGFPSRECGHFHRHTYAILSVLEYALSVDDRDLMAFVRGGYEWARDKGHGSSLVGFFPELYYEDYPTSETCEVADMIALALKLTRAGMGDYWDDADRWIRNQFIENQLVRVDWVDRILRPGARVGDNISTDRVAERNIGCFAGWPSASDWSVHTIFTPPIGTMHCCTGNAARVLYYIWEHIVDHTEGRLRVNLLLNRASPWADLDSYIPYQGRVELRVKEPCRSVEVRVPQWTESGSEEVACTVNGVARELTWDGRYVHAGAAAPGDSIRISFPISERLVRERIGGIMYTLVVRGNDVVFIDPPGKNCPLYQRAHYRENEPRWRKVERFVSDEHVDW